jgi:hypothetical protein
LAAKKLSDCLPVAVVLKMANEERKFDKQHGAPPSTSGKLTELLANATCCEPVAPGHGNRMIVPEALPYSLCGGESS